MIRRCTVYSGDMKYVNVEQKLVSIIISTPTPLPQSRFYLTYVEHRSAALLLPAAQAVIELEQGPKASSLPQQSVCIVQ